MLDVARHLERKYGTKVVVKEGLGTNVCSRFKPPEKVGLTKVKVDIFREVDNYYAGIDLCDGS